MSQFLVLLEFIQDLKLGAAGPSFDISNSYYNIINRPVVVSFEELHTREEVLKESGKLKGSNVFITEDLSR